MNPRHTRVTNTLAAAALPLALLVGCSGEEPEPKFPDEPSSSPTEASPSEPVEPTPPAAMERGDEAGAKAFVEYYFAMVNYARLTGETKDLSKLGLRSCTACDSIINTIVETRSNGGRIQGGDFTPTSVRLAALGKVSAHAEPFQGIVQVSFTKQVIEGSGDERIDGEYPAGRQRLEMVAVHSRAGWTMGSWKVVP